MMTITKTVTLTGSSQFGENKVCLLYTSDAADE